MLVSSRDAFEAIGRSESTRNSAFFPSPGLLSRLHLGRIRRTMMHSSDKVGSLGDISGEASRAVRIGFLLIDDFALMSYASIIEPFRAANRLSGRELYEWRHYSVDGHAARPSTGVT